MHLNDLRNIDYAGTSAEDMTVEQISLVAERYNRGPSENLDDIINYPNGYAARVIDNMEEIMEALQ